MKTFYMTFGCCHLFADYFVKILAENVEEAHKKATENFGTKWSWLYDEKKWTVVDSFPGGQIGRTLV